MRLKELRKKANLKLEDVANMLGVSYQTISNWENGITEPDIQSIKKIASHFNVTTDYLIEYDNEKAYMQDMLHRLDYLSKDELLLITKSLVKDLINRFYSISKKSLDEKQ